ncbi:Tryptophan synthase alpha chain [Minicystis rosea]|nr:Tryptophan synthase alpha chain [Minicystis rosea]
MRALPYLLATVVPIVAVAACGSTPSDGHGGSSSTSNGTGGSSSSGKGGAGDTGGSTGTGIITLPDAGTDGGGTCVAYKSCADLGYDCGAAPDGCGDVQDCGTCTAPAVCGGNGKQNVCGTPPCNPKTCADQGFDCGMASDTCGGTLDCGTCGTGQTCGAQSANACGSGVCVPKTCADQGYQCGMQGDGCGNALDCGTCAANQACGGGANPQNGICGITCVPKTCADQGFNCGMATDGCGNVLDCSMGASCPAGQICGGGGTNVCGGNGCAAGTELVYVWGLNNKIYSFDPPTKTFTVVATPDCLASDPNSMAIDRDLVAWLNYLTPGAGTPNQYIYKFDLKTKTGCTASGIQIPSGFTQVGMGFSSDTPGGNTETLYLDGIGGAGLARVDMATKTVIPIGNFSNDPKLTGQSAELTGTGNALLYGYFTTSPYVRVAQLDKTNGNAISDSQVQGSTPRATGRSRSGEATSTSTRTPTRATRPTAASFSTTPTRTRSTSRTWPTSASRSSAPGSPPARRRARRRPARRPTPSVGRRRTGAATSSIAARARPGRRASAARARPAARPRPARTRASRAACRATAAATRSTAATAPRA